MTTQYLRFTSRQTGNWLDLVVSRVPTFSDSETDKALSETRLVTVRNTPDNRYLFDMACVAVAAKFELEGSMARDPEEWARETLFALRDKMRTFVRDAGAHVAPDKEVHGLVQHWRVSVQNHAAVAEERFEDVVVTTVAGILEPHLKRALEDIRRNSANLREPVNGSVAGIHYGVDSPLRHAS